MCCREESAWRRLSHYIERIHTGNSVIKRLQEEGLTMSDAPSPVMFAVVTSKREAVSGGMAPIFFAEDDKERDRIAMWISRITNATVHDLHNGTLILTTSASGQVGSG